MNIINLVKSKIAEIYPNAEVILFGSRARGDFNKDSDWDFLILVDSPVDLEFKEITLERIYDLELWTGSVISIFIHTKKDWEDRSITPIYQVIKKEGIRA